MPRVVALIAAAIILMAGAVRFAAAGIQFGTTSCCCGPHASNHSCGCPDCPSAVQADPHGDDDHDDDHPAMGRCGANGQILLPMAAAPVLAASPRPELGPVRPVVLVHTPPPPPLQTRLRGPEPPPPR